MPPIMTSGWSKNEAAAIASLLDAVGFRVWDCDWEANPSKKAGDETNGAGSVLLNEAGLLCVGVHDGVTLVEAPDTTGETDHEPVELERINNAVDWDCEHEFDCERLDNCVEPYCDADTVLLWLCEFEKGVVGDRLSDWDSLAVGERGHKDEDADIDCDALSEEVIVTVGLVLVDGVNEGVDDWLTGETFAGESNWDADADRVWLRERSKELDWDELWTALSVGVRLFVLVTLWDWAAEALRVGLGELVCNADRVVDCELCEIWAWLGLCVEEGLLVWLGLWVNVGLVVTYIDDDWLCSDVGDWLGVWVTDKLAIFEAVNEAVDDWLADGDWLAVEVRVGLAVDDALGVPDCIWLVVDCDELGTSLIDDEGVSVWLADSVSEAVGERDTDRLGDSDWLADCVWLVVWLSGGRVVLWLCVNDSEPDPDIVCVSLGTCELESDCVWLGVNEREGLTLWLRVSDSDALQLCERVAELDAAAASRMCRTAQFPCSVTSATEPDGSTAAPCGPKNDAAAPFPSAYDTWYAVPARVVTEPLDTLRTRTIDVDVSTMTATAPIASSAMPCGL
jgi:hypothetical protein